MAPMPPVETSPLLYDEVSYREHFNLDEASGSSQSDEKSDNDTTTPQGERGCGYFLGIFLVAFCTLSWVLHSDSFVGTKLRSKVHSVAQDLADKTAPKYKLNGSGPYSLVEAHKGKSFFDFYDFEDGPDSLGSAGYNTYVGKEKAEERGLIKVESDGDDGDGDDDDDEYVYMSSKAGTEYDDSGNRFRDSIRLEGKRRFDHGLILLDVAKMPTGCGVWPAFWSTDEEDWPKNGEIDIVEPINNQVVAKTALHTSEDCTMYANVPYQNHTGYWDSATGLPETFTGIPDFNTTLPADNCWWQTPHQWLNQGCVAINHDNTTLGAPMNVETGGMSGGIYALEWDPRNRYIRSWVFPRATDSIPSNLQEALDRKDGSVRPDPLTWPVPYAYFAIGETTGCSADHFRNHHLVINLAFCGSVAGNRFQRDCPALYEKYNDGSNSSIAACNAYIDSVEAQPLLEAEAFWKIKGVYLYQREEE